MPMKAVCPSCRAEIPIRDEHAGKRGRCPNCKAIFTAPVPELALVEAGSVGGAGRLAEAGVPPPLRPAPAVNEDGDSAGLRACGRVDKKGKGGPGTRRAPARRRNQRQGGDRGSGTDAEDLDAGADLGGVSRRDRAGSADDSLPALDRDRRRHDGTAPPGVRRDHWPCRRRRCVSRGQPHHDPPVRRSPGQCAQIRGLDLCHAADCRGGGRRAHAQATVRSPRAGPDRRCSIPAPSRCCTRSSTACADRSVRRGRLGLRSIAESMRRRTAKGESSACSAEIWCSRSGCRSWPGSRSNSLPACLPTNSVTSRKALECGSMHSSCGLTCGSPG